MDFKDFKRVIKDSLKVQNTFKQLSYLFKNRTSRPRAKKNVINPKQKGI
jgi:hypothetical protein